MGTVEFGRPYLLRMLDHSGSGQDPTEVAMSSSKHSGFAPRRSRDVARPKPSFRPALVRLESRDLPGGMVAVANTGPAPTPNTGAAALIGLHTSASSALIRKLGSIREVFAPNKILFQYKPNLTL